MARDIAAPPAFREPESWDFEGVEEGMKMIGERRTNVSWISALTMLSFVLSILLALSAIAKLTNDAGTGYFLGPLAFMFEGIAGIFWMVARSA